MGKPVEVKLQKINYQKKLIYSAQEYEKSKSLIKIVRAISMIVNS